APLPVRPIGRGEPNPTRGLLESRLAEEPPLQRVEHRDLPRPVLGPDDGERPVGIRRELEGHVAEQLEVINGRAFELHFRAPYASSAPAVFRPRASLKSCNSAATR